MDHTQFNCHVNPDHSVQIINEETLYKCSGACLTELDISLKIDHLELKITSHRMILFHPTNRIFNFEFHYNRVDNHILHKKGLFSKKIYKIEISYSGKSYKVKLASRDNFEVQAKKFVDALNNQNRWRVENVLAVKETSSAFGKQNPNF